MFSPAIIAARKIPSKPISGRFESFAWGSSLASTAAGDKAMPFIERAPDPSRHPGIYKD
jgi:hypothetical protein